MTTDAALMDRVEWLAERRAAVKAQYDSEAPDYDDNPYPTTSHSAFVARLLETCPPDGVVLDQPQINRVFDGQGSMVGDDCMDDWIERHRVQGFVGGRGLHAGEREQLLHEVRGAFDTAL